MVEISQYLTKTEWNESRFDGIIGSEIYIG